METSTSRLQIDFEAESIAFLKRVDLQQVSFRRTVRAQRIRLKFIIPSPLNGVGDPDTAAPAAFRAPSVTN